MKMEARLSRWRTSQQIEDLLDPELDPSLWSKLSEDILLIIFDALPVKDHYRLRRVCKLWHNRASERRRLLTLDQVCVPEPFFLLIQKSQYERSPFGTLALHVKSGKWMWRPFHSMWNLSAPSQWYEIGHLYESFEVEGVLFEGKNIAESTKGTLIMDAFHDVHRNHPEHKEISWSFIPHVDIGPGSVLGMMVDDTSRAYTLILGSCGADTLVLDSQTNKWESKPSRLVRAKLPCASTAPKSCVQLQGKMYLWIDSNEIHVYSPSSNQWCALAAPPRDTSAEDEFRGLGHWAGALYAMTKNEQGTLSVWKLNMADEQWSKYAQIPGSFFGHLMQPGMLLPIMASHCNGYLLIHVVEQPNNALEPKRTMRMDELRENKSWWYLNQKLGRRFILFNIDNRRWEMVDMPYKKMWKKPRK